MLDVLNFQQVVKEMQTKISPLLWQSKSIIYTNDKKYNKVLSKELNRALFKIL